MLKRTGEEVDYVASFVTEIIFKAKLDSRMGEWFLGSFTYHTIGNDSLEVDPILEKPETWTV